MIKVTDRFYINATTNCYVLQEKTTVKDKKSENYGKEIFKDLGYYTTIESCLKGILKVTIKEFVSKEEETSIYELMKQIKKAEEYLYSLNLDV